MIFFIVKYQQFKQKNLKMFNSSSLTQLQVQAKAEKEVEIYCIQSLTVFFHHIYINNFKRTTDIYIEY